MKKTMSKVCCLVSLSCVLFVGQALANTKIVNDPGFKLITGKIEGSAPDGYTIMPSGRSISFPFTRNADGSVAYSIITNNLAANGVGIILSLLSSPTHEYQSIPGECDVVFRPGKAPLITSFPIYLANLGKKCPITCSVDSQDNITYKVSPPVSP